MIEKFGTYQFTFWQGFFVFLIRKKIARGSIRKWVRRLFWSACPALPIFDVGYGDLRLRISPMNNFLETNIILQSGTYDRQEIDFLASSLVGESVFVDIGANFGYYSLMVASECPQARIISYEPNPVVFDRLVTNIELNNFGNITALNSAVGDKDGVAELKIDDRDSAFSSIRNKEGRTGENDAEIELTSLKNSLEKLDIKKIHALKIDIEGFEDKALLPYFKSVDFQYHPDMIVIEHLNQEDWDDNVIDYLLANGYYEFARTGDNLILKKANNDD